MNYVSEDLISKSELRNQMINRIDVLNKVKKLFLIPKLEMMPTNMVADFYEVDQKVIRQILLRHKEEIESDGVESLSGQKVALVLHDVTPVENLGKAGYKIDFNDGTSITLNHGNRVYFSPRAVLRIGMLLRDSEVAKEVRTQLLNTFECATEEQRTESIDEESRLLLDIIRAESDDLVAINLKKYRDFMNRHITKLENEKAELKTELDVVHNQITTWNPNEITRCLISAVARDIGGKNQYQTAWGKLRKNLYHHQGINLEARRVKSGVNKPYIHFVKDNEWDHVIKEVYIIAKDHNIDIVKCVGSTNAQSIEKFATE